MSSSEFFTTPVITNGYTHFKLLRESGFNILYSAEREGKRFVVKALSKAYQGDMLYESILRKEFEIGYFLDHPNICRTLSFEQFPEVGNAIVMEWIDGRTLDNYISENKQHSSKERGRIVEQLCDALGYAHKRQIIHRDLKPQNIIITHNGDNVKLLDFGLSDTDSHTAFKEPAGSRKYASPELQSGGEVTSRTDIYSLGIIISELFKGKRTRIVTRATTFHPESRYANTDDLARAFKKTPIRLIYPILITTLVAIVYLFIAQNRSTEVLIPSAQADGVSQEEFERRQVLCNDFYREINNSYLSLMNDEVYKISCATPDMPNFELLGSRQIEYYNRVLDSMLCDIKKSSLYINAKRNIASHNRELFTTMRNTFPAMFWLHTENLYRSALDSLTDSLKRLPAPQLVQNYTELSFAEQQVESERYQKAVNSYKKSTVEVWAIEYRKHHNLSPLPSDLFKYYSQIEE